MPLDRPLVSTEHRNVQHTEDPVELAKRYLDAKNVVYACRYNYIEDMYIIEVDQKRLISDDLAQKLRILGFSNTGKIEFYYKRYSQRPGSHIDEFNEPDFGDDILITSPNYPAPELPSP